MASGTCGGGLVASVLEWVVICFDQGVVYASAIIAALEV